MRIVLDTNILIRANPKARGPARELLQRIVSGNDVLVASPFLLQELAGVLAYPRVEARWKLSKEEIEEYVQILAAVCEVVVPESGVPVALKDANDAQLSIPRSLEKLTFCARWMRTSMIIQCNSSARKMVSRSWMTSRCYGYCASGKNDPPAC